jgi:hypothetical protein
LEPQLSLSFPFFAHCVSILASQRALRVDGDFLLIKLIAVISHYNLMRAIRQIDGPTAMADGFSIDECRFGSDKPTSSKYRLPVKKRLLPAGQH